MNYITIFAVEQDTSATVLSEWQEAGFREVVWIYQQEPWSSNQKWLEMGGTCPTCMALNGQHLKIQDLLADMTHDAPKYSKSHIGCKCLLKRLPREEEILDYPEETPITEEAPKAEEAPAVAEPPKPEETQNP